MRHIFGQFSLRLSAPARGQIEEPRSGDTGPHLVEQLPDTEIRVARNTIPVATACEQFKKRMKELGRAI